MVFKYTNRMRAYEVFLNGKKLCVAGIASDGYISAYITYVSEGNKTWIDVTGLDNRKKRYVQWARTKLRTGDEVSLKVVDLKSVDKYKTIRRHDEKRDIESTKRETRRNAKAFGWEIVEKRKVK